MHYNGCNYLSMLGLKLNHVSKRGPRCDIMCRLQYISNLLFFIIVLTPDSSYFVRKKRWTGYIYIYIFRVLSIFAFIFIVINVLFVINCKIFAVFREIRSWWKFHLCRCYALCNFVLYWIGIYRKYNAVLHWNASHREPVQSTELVECQDTA